MVSMSTENPSSDPCLGWEDSKKLIYDMQKEFLNHKFIHTFFYKTQATGVYILWLAHYFVGLLFNHITISKNCTDCFGILDFPGINHVAQLL